MLALLNISIDAPPHWRRVVGGGMASGGVSVVFYPLTFQLKRNYLFDVSLDGYFSPEGTSNAGRSDGI